MDTTPFEQLEPRLVAVQSEILSIRRTLNAAIAQTREAAPPVTPAPSPERKASQPEPPPVPPAPVPTAPAPLEPEPPLRRNADFEALLAGRWLNLGGLLLVFLGTAFFLKVAFDHNWIVPEFRVAMGLVGGAVLIAYARRLSAKGQTYFSEGITALGAAIEFLSLYASNAMFHLASPVLVLGGMVAVNAVLAAISWRERSQRLALLAAFGGFFAPLLAGINATDPWMLAAYLAMLTAGLLLLGEILESQIVAPVALAGMTIYALSGFAWASSLDDVQRAAIFLILYAAFAVWGWVRAQLHRPLHPLPTIASALAMGIVVLELEATLGTQHKPVLAAALLGLAALHLGAAAAFKSRLHSWYAAVALTFAIPAAFSNVYVNIAWAVEAAALGIAGARYRDDVLRGGALLVLGMDSMFALVAYSYYKPAIVLWNDRFIAASAMIISAYVIAKYAFIEGASEAETGIVTALRIGTHVVALLAISMEAWDGVQHYGGTIQGSSAALSVVWAAFAGTLIAAGLRKRDALLRWEGLGLIIATAAKVLLVDLASLEIAYRVVSAVLVGIALIVVSYAYQRRANAERTSP